MSDNNTTRKEPFTVKGFVKSTSFKCIAVLLAIVLVSGILLTVCNSLFYVSAAEKLQRTLNKIYGKEVTAEEVEINAPNIGGFEIVTDGSTAGFGGSMAEDIKDGSLFVKMTESDVLALLNADGEFTTGNLGNEMHTGATNSNFLCVYAALFASANYEAVLNGKSIDDFVYTKFIDKEKTTFEADGKDVVYSIASNANGLIWGQFVISVTVGEGGVVSDFTITQNGSSQMPEQDYGDLMNESVKDGTMFVGKDKEGIRGLFNDDILIDTADGTLATGATYSNFLCAYGALFALSNYDAVKNNAVIDDDLNYTQYIDPEQTSAKVSEDGTVDYTVVTTDYGRAHAFTLKISVRGGLTTEYTGGKVNSAYYIADDGNYLINATGDGGYNGGTVTCWVVVAMDEGSVKGIDRVMIDSNSGQSYISKVNRDDVLSALEGTFETGEEVSAWSGTGATMSLTAIVAAANTALSFARSELATSTAPDPLAGFEYTKYINTYATSVTVSGSDVYYKIVTSAYSPAQSFTINVTVGEGGVITAYSIEKNGSTADKYIDRMPGNVKDGSLYIGKNADGILELMRQAGISDDGSFEESSGGELSTGATYSNVLCTYAALFAAANYEFALENAGGAQ